MYMDLKFTGERIVPEAENCEPNFAKKMYQEHITRYNFAEQFILQKFSILDVGCGIGYGSQRLSKKAESVIAFDLSQDAINHANKYYKEENINFLVENAETFNFEMKFDLVTCFELIEHVYEQDLVIKNIASVLKEDGLLIISTPRPLLEKRTSFHTKELNLNDFKKMINKYFKNIELFVENNHFSSLITRSEDLNKEIIIDTLDNEVFKAINCDYFICVASNKEINLNDIKSNLVLNNENYVKLLERDCSILHEAEDNLKVVVQNLEKDCAILHEAEDNLKVVVQNLEKDCAILHEAEDNLKNEKLKLESELMKIKSNFFIKLLIKLGVFN